jgi:hypothetical protein
MTIKVERRDAATATDSAACYALLIHLLGGRDGARGLKAIADA